MKDNTDKRLPLKLESTPTKIMRNEAGEIECMFSKKVDEVEIKKMLGTRDSEIAMDILKNTVVAMDKNADITDKINIALQSFHDQKPKDAIEAKLISQMTCLYEKGLHFLSLTNFAEEVNGQVYGNLAVKFLRLHLETIEALCKYRRGGEQKVVVQYQHVQANQAVVNQFNGDGGVLKNSGGSPCSESAEQDREPTAIDHAVNLPFPMGDAASMAEKVPVQGRQKEDAE